MVGWLWWDRRNQLLSLSRPTLQLWALQHRHRSVMINDQRLIIIKIRWSASYHLPFLIFIVHPTHHNSNYNHQDKEDDWDNKLWSRDHWRGQRRWGWVHCSAETYLLFTKICLYQSYNLQRSCNNICNVSVRWLWPDVKVLLFRCCWRCLYPGQE